jgi:uncharacterized protein YcfJ
MNKAIHLFVFMIVIAGCANEPIVDRRGVDESKYQQDLAECRSYASQVDTPGETAKSGAIGAAVGVAVGAIVGNSHDAKRGAGIGAVAGGGRGLNKAEHRKEKIMFRCLQGRGYRVLG